MSTRTKFLVLVSLCAILEVYSESDVVRLNYDVDEVKTVDLLLRGSGEDEEVIDKKVNIKNIDQEKSSSDQDTTDYEDTESKNAETESPKYTTTDEFPTTTDSIIPEALGLKNDDEDKRDATTETDIAETTVTIIDNNVYRGTNEDIYSSSRYNVVSKVRVLINKAYL